MVRTIVLLEVCQIEQAGPPVSCLSGYSAVQMAGHAQAGQGDVSEALVAAQQGGGEDLGGGQA